MRKRTSSKFCIWCNKNIGFDRARGAKIDILIVLAAGIFIGIALMIEFGSC